MCVCVCETHLHVLRVFEVWSDSNQAISPWEWGGIMCGMYFQFVVCVLGHNNHCMVTMSTIIAHVWYLATMYPQDLESSKLILL